MFDNQRDESDEDDDDDDDQETDSDCGGVVVGLLPPQRKVGQSQIWRIRWNMTKRNRNNL